MPEESRNSKTEPPDEGPDQPISRGSSDGIPSLTGVILAGGQSRRYGTNKALEKLDGIPLIEHACMSLKKAVSQVVISTNEPEIYEFLGLPMFRDQVKGLGPLSGIHAALRFIRGEAGFFVACDMPFLNPSLIRHMAECCRDADAVVPRIGPYVEPLHSLYKKTCRPSVDHAVARREKKIVSFFGEIKVHYVEESMIRRYDPEMETFVNINNPEEFRKAVARRRAGPHSARPSEAHEQDKG